MKFLLSMLVFLSGAVATATVDVQGEAFIVVENIQEVDVYDLRKVPVEYCAGIPALTLPEAVTKPVVIKANYGCGHGAGMVFDRQINAATCVSVSSEEVANADGSYNSRTVSVEIDLSNCGDKANSSNFESAVTDAIYKTLNQYGYQITSFTKK